MTEPCNLAKNLSKSFADLYNKFTELEILLNKTIESEAELLNRVFALEEKERARTAKETQLPYDEWAEGEAIIHERRDIEPDTTVFSPSQEEHDREIELDNKPQDPW